ncbi:hypothetical protein [Siphonobacter curvatus]|nr:hypothetical protein [Siphonobacter curvatus]
MVHVSIDYFLDLHTFTDSGTVALVAGVAVLPLAVYTLFRLLPSLEWPWYGTVLIAFAIVGFYVLSAYFTVKNWICSGVWLRGPVLNNSDRSVPSKKFLPDGRASSIP